MSGKPTWPSVFLDVGFMTGLIVCTKFGILDKTTFCGLLAALIGGRIVQVKNNNNDKNGDPPAGGPGLSSSLLVLVVFSPLAALVNELILKDWKS
jgi:hypothetical protein